MADETGGTCPLCGEAFDHHVSYRRHLSKVHDLQDEPGTRTTFRSALARPVSAPVEGGRRIGKKPNLEALPDVWDPVDPTLARRLGREVVEEVAEPPLKKPRKKAAKTPTKAPNKQ